MREFYDLLFPIHVSVFFKRITSKALRPTPHLDVITVTVQLRDVMLQVLHS